MTAKDRYYAFGLPQDLSQSLKQLNGLNGSIVDEPQLDSQATSVGQTIKPRAGDGCIVCGITGIPAAEFRSHFKSDFHLYNVKRNRSGLPPVSEADFDKLVTNLDDNESISGSESDSDEDRKDSLSTVLERTSIAADGDDDSDNAKDATAAAIAGSPYVFFESPALNADEKCLAAFKSLFLPSELESGANLVESLSKAANSHSVILMIGGGHFSGAVISHQLTPGQKPTPTNPYAHLKILAHKSFHRYTTRRKQGGSQSSSDAAHGKAHSAGSSLRRYNEMALQAETRELLASWKKLIDTAHSIYVRANGPNNRAILMNYDGAPITGRDQRIKKLPFSTRRATAVEVKRAWVLVTTASVIAKPKPAPPATAAPGSSTPASAKSKPASPKPVKKERTAAEKHTVELVSLIKKSRSPRFIAYIKSNGLSPDFKLEPTDQYSSTPTPLFYAASKGSHHIVTTLLVSLKADPTIANAGGRHAYDLSADRATKDSFQLARSVLGENAFNWSAAKVGPPLTKEDITARETAESQQAAQERQEAIAKYDADQSAQKLDKTVYKHGPGKKLSSTVATTMSSEASLRGLSEEGRVKLERERRARAAEARFKKLGGGN